MDNDMEQILGSQMTGFESEFDNNKENIEIEPENVLLIVEDDGNDDDHGSFVEKKILKCSQKKKDTGILEDITDAHRDGTNLDRDKSSANWSQYTPEMLKMPVSSKLKYRKDI
ncbi:hypothetical protein NQ314_003506 [Rhamnusium bicolor]|uniref:Uncharacterized protein n=1 Tax=Rhamnusium bicolor TaxID=1586634 RepID=A0AAV8ZNG2_9CUCU|nr:hypothetical protein NQ314_003506 [Rhamnusium bicolor]